MKIVEQMEREAEQRQKEIADARAKYGIILARDIEGTATADDAKEFRDIVKVLRFSAKQVCGHRDRLAELLDARKSIPDQAARKEKALEIAGLWREHNAMVDRHRQELAALNEKIAVAESEHKAHNGNMQTARELEAAIRRDLPVLLGDADAEPQAEPAMKLGPQFEHAVKHDAFQVR